MNNLITPYGGRLINLLVPRSELAERKAYANSLPAIQISERTLCDLECLAVGAFSPLDRFMSEADYRSVLANMRLDSGRLTTDDGRLSPDARPQTQDPGPRTPDIRHTKPASDLQPLTSGREETSETLVVRSTPNTQHPEPTLFPIPITLPLPDDFEVEPGTDIALRDARMNLLAYMTVEEIYRWDLAEEADCVYGSHDPRHPVIAEMYRWGKRNASGKLRVLQLPVHHDFRDLRLTPAQTREALEVLASKSLAEGPVSSVSDIQTTPSGRNVTGETPVSRLGSDSRLSRTDQSSGETSETLVVRPAPNTQHPAPIRVVAFQTRNPLHRVHEELIRRSLESVGGLLLLHPVVGMTKSGDVDHYTRVRTYKALSDYFDHDRSLLSLLPLAMRFAGPREALWHAIIRRNYGASHLIVGRGFASPFLDTAGHYFHQLYEAQQLVERHQEELGVTPVCVGEMVYIPDEDRYEELSRVPSAASRVPSLQSPVSRLQPPASVCEETSETLALRSAPGSRLPHTRVAHQEDKRDACPTPNTHDPIRFSSRMFKEQYLDRDIPLPEWFARPEVAAILRESHPPRHEQGVCIWFTGLSGSGKSTIAEVLTTLLAEHGRQITLLDGDVVRTHLSKGLGFSAEDRDTNIRRIGFVAAEISRHGGTVICAAISPYRATRNDARNMVGTDNFVEVFVDTPLEVCESRDIKGLYAKARRGEIKGFTGIDDPYEPPEHPEVVLDTVRYNPEENAERIVDYLRKERFVR